MQERFLPGDEQRVVTEAEAIIREAQNPGVSQKMDALKGHLSRPGDLFLATLLDSPVDPARAISILLRDLGPKEAQKFLDERLREIFLRSLGDMSRENEIKNDLPHSPIYKIIKIINSSIDLKMKKNRNRVENFGEIEGQE